MAQFLPTQNTEDIFEMRFIGQVKWFNITSGYGFITCCNYKDIFPKNDKGDTDIFVHFSSITKSNQKIKTPFLMQGEYVEFSVIKPETPKVNKEGKVYEYHADDVTGLFRGSLFCDFFTYNNFNNYLNNVGGGGGGQRKNMAAPSVVKTFKANLNATQTAPPVPEDDGKGEFTKVVNSRATKQQKSQIQA